VLGVRRFNGGEDVFVQHRWVSADLSLPVQFAGFYFDCRIKVNQTPTLVQQEWIVGRGWWAIGVKWWVIVMDIRPSCSTKIRFAATQLVPLMRERIHKGHKGN